MGARNECQAWGRRTQAPQRCRLGCDLSRPETEGGEGVAGSPHPRAGEGPEVSGGDAGGAGGPHHHRAATVVLETIGVALGSQPYTLLRLWGPDMREESEQGSGSSFITFPPPRPVRLSSLPDTCVLTPPTHTQPGPGTSPDGGFPRQPPGRC